MRLKRKINWIPGEKPIVAALPPHPLMAEKPLEENENCEALKAGLVPGSLWFIRCDLAVDRRFSGAGYKAHEFPYIAHLKNGPFAKGTPAIYAGLVRVEEESRKGRVVSARRHSFIVGGARYITNDIGRYFRPA